MPNCERNCGECGKCVGAHAQLAIDEIRSERDRLKAENEKLIQESIEDFKKTEEQLSALTAKVDRYHDALESICQTFEAELKRHGAGMGYASCGKLVDVARFTLKGYGGRPASAQAAGPTERPCCVEAYARGHAVGARDEMMGETQHLLVILGEECAEVAQRASKAIRFGLAEVQPGQTQDNRRRLEGELADVLATAELLGLQVRDEDKAAKREKLKEFMAYARDRGTLGAE